METHGVLGLDMLCFALAVDGGEFVSRPGRFTPKERTLPYTSARRLGASQSRSGRCGVGKIPCTFRKLNPGHQFRIPLLYRLRYTANY
jgi:hypothetical protein